MNKIMLSLIVSSLYCIPVVHAVDYQKLSESVDTQKATESVDQEKMGEAVSTEGVDYNKAYESVDKEKAADSVDVDKVRESLGNWQSFVIRGAMTAEMHLRKLLRLAC